MDNPCGNNECNKINSGIDECIKPLIKALNDCGMETVASCCGHGNTNTNGNVVLKDGREIIIVPDFKTARRIEKYFPDIHGNKIWLGNFKPDTRMIELHERLQKYYDDTPDSVSGQTVITLWADFKQWCSCRGYTQEEINQAKRGKFKQ